MHAREIGRLTNGLCVESIIPGALDLRFDELGVNQANGGVVVTRFTRPVPGRATGFPTG